MDILNKIKGWASALADLGISIAALMLVLCEPQSTGYFGDIFCIFSDNELHIKRALSGLLDS